MCLRGAMLFRPARELIPIYKTHSHCSMVTASPETTSICTSPQAKILRTDSYQDALSLAKSLVSLSIHIAVPPEPDLETESRVAYVPQRERILKPLAYATCSALKEAGDPLLRLLLHRDDYFGILPSSMIGYYQYDRAQGGSVSTLSSEEWHEELENRDNQWPDYFFAEESDDIVIA